MSELLNRLKNLPSAKKKRYVALALVFLICSGVAFGVLGYNMVAGELTAPGEITWSHGTGDIFYFGLKDDYSYKNTDDSEYIRQFRTVLKSEILNKTDLEIDWDDDEDLVIMSSFLFGKEGLYSVEIPNWFDLYQGFLLLNNIIELTSGYEPKVLDEWALPSAIHYQVSSPYHALQAFSEHTDAEGLGQELMDSNFTDILDLMEYLEINTFFNEKYEETFDGPLTYEVQTQYPDNNSAEITGDEMLKLEQEGETAQEGQDDLNVSRDLFDWYSATEVGERVSHIGEFIYQPLDLNLTLLPTGTNKLNHVFEVSLGTDPFDIVAAQGQETATNYSGQNGIKFRFNDGILEVHTGDFIYNETHGLFTENSHPGWKQVAPFDWGTDGGKLEIQVTNRDRSRFTRQQTYDLSITSNTSVHRSYYELPYSFDCPFDFRAEDCYDLQKDKPRLFRATNMTNLEFKVSGSDGPENSVDMLDNITVYGNLLYGMDNLQDLSSYTLLSSFYLLSIYHLLIYPNEFDFGTIAAVISLLNQIIEVGLGYSDFFIIEETSTDLTIEIPEASFTFLFGMLENLTVQGGVYNALSFIEGDVDSSFILEFDKELNVLSKSYFIIEYADTGIVRETGIELIAASEGDVSNEVIENRLNELEKEINELKAKSGDHSKDITELEKEVEELEIGLVRVYDEYPAYPDSEWMSGDEIDQLMEDYKRKLLVSALLFGGALLLISVGISAGITYYMTHRQEDRTWETPKPQKKRSSRKEKKDVFTVHIRDDNEIYFED
jgi:hypothetical protein